MQNKFLILLVILCTFSFQKQVLADSQNEAIYTLPNVDVDTTSFPALRILRQLHKHEKENVFDSIHSFDLYTEGDYFFMFKSSKFLKGYMKGAMSVMGFPRLAKIFIKNDSVSHKIHARHRFQNGKMKEVCVKLDSANIELTEKQYSLIKRSNLNLDWCLTTQFRNPKCPWGSKSYVGYEWQLVDTLTMYGHRVDVLEFHSIPKKGLKRKLIGEQYGRICVIEDYWQIIDLEHRSLKNRSRTHARLVPIAPGVFRPSVLLFVDDYSMDVSDFLTITKTDPNSLDEGKRNKLEEVMSKAEFGIVESYSLRLRYDNVVEKNK